jgi:HEAT repeat protein
MRSLKEYATQLDGPDEAERTYAAEDIGYLNDPGGVAVLLERLDKESSSAVRDIIFQALVRIDGDAAIEGCIRLFASEDPQKRNQAVDALRHKGGQVIPFLNRVMRDGDRDMRKLVLDTLKGDRSIGTDEIYGTALSDPDQNVVITAVENLGQIRAKEFRGRIEGLIQADSHPMLIAVCLEALAKIGCDSPLDAMPRCLPC